MIISKVNYQVGYFRKDNCFVPIGIFENEKQALKFINKMKPKYPTKNLYLFVKVA